MIASPCLADRLLLRFTSLGDNCEFGLAQRRAGAEPLGLFRLAACAIDPLIAALADHFADLDPPTRLDVSQPWGEEFITFFGDRGFYHHTLATPADTDAATLRRQEAQRIPFLRRRLLEDLAAADTIFVRKSASPDPARMHALHAALRRHHPANRLLWVEPGPLALDQPAPGLFRGRLPWFAPIGDATALHFDGWLRLCRAVLDRLGQATQAADPPPALRIGVDAAMGGWDGMACTQGGPVPPPRPGGQVFTHTAGASGPGCGAVLNPQPRLREGELWTGSVYVWLPPDRAPSRLAPVLTHIPGARTLPAVPTDRASWQRLWVAAAIPPATPTIDFALWGEWRPGDHFYSTDWSLTPTATPAAYWLRP